MDCFSTMESAMQSEDRMDEIGDTGTVPMVVAEESELEPILSQDFFCTPDFITPEDHQFFTSVATTMENMECPRPPMKARSNLHGSVRSKRSRQGSLLAHNVDGNQSSQDEEFSILDLSDSEVSATGTLSVNLQTKRRRNCFKNPFLAQTCDQKNEILSEVDFAPEPELDCPSRYHEEYDVVEEIGRGISSFVYKVLDRFDGCFYVMKCKKYEQCEDSGRMKALNEVQAMATIGSHKNVVKYHTAWLENDHLYIQLQLCDGNLHSLKKQGLFWSERSLLDLMQQITRALKIVHGHGIVHLDVKPDNIYVLNGAFKLGGFCHAAKLGSFSSPEELDMRYMPKEIWKKDYRVLDKVDIFSLGITICELAKGSDLPLSRILYGRIKDDEIPIQISGLESILKHMTHPIPSKRPTAKGLLKLLFKWTDK